MGAARSAQRSPRTVLPRRHGGVDAQVRRRRRIQNHWGRQDPNPHRGSPRQRHRRSPLRQLQLLPPPRLGPCDLGWSLDFLRPPVDAPEARAILEAHSPIYDNPKVDTSMTDFARAHPEYRSFTRDRSYTLQPGQDLYLSLAFPEVRAEQTKQFVDVLEETDGTGVQVEFVLGNEDENGVVTYGYEEAVASKFEEAHGRNPQEIPNDDPAWVQFRADYVTRYMVEARDAVKAAKPDAVFSATMIAGEAGDYVKLLHDWPAWVDAARSTSCSSGSAPTRIWMRLPGR